MKTRTMVAVTLGLALAAGCTKKKEKDQAGGTTVGGSAAMKPEGSAPPPPPPEPPKPAPKTGKDLAQMYIDCTNLINAAKWDDFGKQCVAESFVGHMAGGPDTTRDKVLTHLGDMKVAFPDMKFEPQLVFVNGRNIAAVTLMKGTNDGPFKSEMGSFEPTKKKVGMLMYERFVISEDNKATEQWAFVAPGTMMGQLGKLPKGAPPTRPVMEKGLEGAPIIVVAADDDKEKANVELVKKANDAFNAKKLPDVMAFYADDVLESDQAGPADVKGKKNMEKGMAGFWKAFSDGKIEVPTLWGAGEYVVMEGKFTGTNDGPMGKMKKTGKKVDQPYAEILKVKDGKIAEAWRFMNDAAMMMQLGVMPAPGGDPAKGADPAKGGTEPAKGGTEPAKGADPAKGAAPAKGADPAKGAAPPKGAPAQ